MWTTRYWPALLCSAMLALQLTAAVHAGAAPRKVTLLVGDALDEQGKPKPMAAWQRKLFDNIEQELDIVFDIRMYPWPRAERNAANGEGLIFGLPKSADRLHVLHYSDVAAVNNLWLVTRSDATFPFRGIADLRGKTVGAVRGFSYGDDFERARGKVFRVDDDISSRATRLTRLMLKRVDVVLLFQANSQSAAEVEAGVNAFMKEPLKSISATPGVSFSVLPVPLSAGSGVYFAIARERDDGIIDRINAALGRLRKTADVAKSPPR
jgi:ABC-type amino acid transport substrate-binding protein